MRARVIGLQCLLAGICLLLPISTLAADKITYSGMSSCGDTSTFVSFSYDAQTKTIDAFEVSDVCTSRLSKKIFSLDGQQPAGAKIVGKWTALEPFSHDRQGNIKYQDELGYQVLGRFKGGALNGTVKAPGRTAIGSLGRPSAKLIECGRGQYFLPCSKWQVVLKD